MIPFAICFFIVGMLILNVWGQLNQGWYEYYYIWDKSKDLFFVIGLYLVDKKYRKIIKPVIIYASARLIWQIISTITGLDINNPKIIGYLFILLAAVCLFLILKELKEWQG